MNNTIRFIINTAPTAQARPRHAVRSGFSVTYKSKQQKTNEQTLEALIAPYAPKEPFKCRINQFCNIYSVPAKLQQKEKRTGKSK